MKKTLHSIVEELVAKNKRKQFTSREIAEIIVKTEPEFVAKKIRKTLKTDKELVFQFMSEIGAQYSKMRRNNVGKTDDRPCKYFYKKSEIVLPAALVQEKVPAKVKVTAKAKATAKKATVKKVTAKKTKAAAKKK